MSKSNLTTPSGYVQDRHRTLRKSANHPFVEVDRTPVHQPGGISLAAVLGASLLSQSGPKFNQRSTSAGGFHALEYE